jgi:acetylornithine/succinyldiaminopimelate/putrescine aminotransferase
VSSWQHPLIHTIRGLGLLIGFELDPNAMLSRTAYTEADGFASIYLVKALMAEGLLTVAAGPLVVRWLPPLNVTRDEVQTALTIFRRVLDQQITK